MKPKIEVDLTALSKGLAPVGKAITQLGKAAAKIGNVINSSIMSQPFELHFFKEIKEVKSTSLLAALRQYKWPTGHIFVHVCPPKALNIPANYFVGEDISNVDVDMDDLGEVYWYNTAKDEVLKATIKVSTKGNRHIKWEPSSKFRFVVDSGNTNFPIGAFVPEDEDWTDILDFSEVTEAQLSEAVQKLPQIIPPFKGKLLKTKKVKNRQEKKVDYREFLDSLPDDED